jgi:RAQPRD family integrative conjugative element protein
MAHSFQFRATGRGALRSLLALAVLALAGTLPVVVWTDSPLQQQELTAALRQIQALERLVETNAASTPIEPGQRSHFDYPRLLADLVSNCTN